MSFLIAYVVVVYWFTVRGKIQWMHFVNTMVLYECKIDDADTSDPEGKVVLKRGFSDSCT